MYMSGENTYYKRIKELEIENSVLSREVITLRKEVQKLTSKVQALKYDMVDLITRNKQLEELLNK